MTYQTDDLYHSLEAFSQSINAFNQLLNDDKENVSKNNLTNMDENHQRKEETLHLIENTLHKIRQFVPSASNEGLIHSLILHTKTLDNVNRKRIETLLESIEENLVNGYESLISHNKVIFKNLEYTKQIWDRLFQLSPENNSIYSKPL